MTIEIPPIPKDPKSSSEDEKVLPMNDTIASELSFILKQTGDAHIRKCSGAGHKAVVVDQVTRTVSCEKCGWAIDPFDYLLGWAIEGDRRNQALKRLDHEIKVTRAELEDLTRQCDNLRGRLKRNGEPQSQESRQEYHHQRRNPHIFKLA